MNRIIDDILLLDLLQADFIVLSNYFTTKADPQSNISRASNDFEYIRLWYESIRRNDLYAVVFHDTLEREFIDDYQTDKIIFIKCRLGQMSLNDERFFVFREFMEVVNNNCFLLTTDINDVVINKSPFDFISKYPEKIFLGRDEFYNWRSFSWSLSKLLEFRTRTNIKIPSDFLLSPIFNAGLIGGHINTLKGLFDRMNAIFGEIGDSGNYNMAILNWVVFKYYSSYPRINLIRFLPFYAFWKLNNSILHGQLIFVKSFFRGQVTEEGEGIVDTKLIYSGFPFCSLFKKYQSHEDSEAFLFHK